MNRYPILLAVTFGLVACTQTPNPVPTQPPPPPPLAPAVKTEAPQPAPDPSLVTNKKIILSVQQALVALGYDLGKPDGKLGSATLRAIIAFEKDRGMREDARLTVLIAEKIRAAAAEETRVTAISVKPGDFLVYSDGEEEIASAPHATTWEQNQPRALVAIRPAMAGWPSAAKAGLDWALSHALDVATPMLKWSSTGIEDKFEIRTYPSLTPRETALVGGDTSSCRKFELRVDISRYPGIACRDPDGNWFIPHSSVRLARPAAGLSPGAKKGGATK